MEYGHIKRKGNVVMAETPTVDADNTLRILWEIAAPIFDADGNRVGAVESIADVTERRKRETALQDNVVKYRKILNFTGTATVIIEEDDTISYMNPEFGRMLGYVKEEVEGKKKWTEFVIPEDIRTMQAVWQRAEFDDSPVRHELRFIRWDGEVRNGYLTITRLPGTGRVVVTLLDITENIQAVKAVQEANRKLNLLNSITRHDILNQLTVLKGNLELAREQAANPADSAMLDKELAAAEAIQSLITFTRDFQDIGSEPPLWQALRDVIVRSCQGLHLEQVTLDVETEGVEVYADRQLARVFSDLIKNAIVHGEKTTRIRIFCQESFEELHIICEDDGIGVPPEAKDRIFTREFFFRTGLDMYLAREILSITRIGIRETGQYGEGAEFELRVPKGGYRFVQKEGLQTNL
jgi:PAS domain S-box-containing protein